MTMGSERAWDKPERMIGVDEALTRILGRFSPLGAAATPILDALEMVVVRDIVSTVDVPPFRNSAMDGYAVRSIDTVDAPVVLRVADRVAAGDVPARDVAPGEAIRVMTGAPVPDGADAVVRFEETDERSRATSRSQREITVGRTILPSENVREAGEDIRVGQTVIRSGARIGPAEVGILASLNLPTVPVHRRPRVAILSTGDEVVELGPVLRPGQIRDSNAYTIAALVREAGGEPVSLGIARDTAEDVRAKLSAGSPPDLFVTSGGVSVGDYDAVKDVLRSEGSVDIWQVRMKPGKPLAFGAVAGVPLIGLPGNPVAAFVSFMQFARPAIRRMLGFEETCLPEIDAVVVEAIENTGRRRHYVRGIVSISAGAAHARPIGTQGSAILTSMSSANCFIVVPETVERVKPGDMLRVQLLGDQLPSSRAVAPFGTPTAIPSTNG